MRSVSICWVAEIRISRIGNGAAFSLFRFLRCGSLRAAGPHFPGRARVDAAYIRRFIDGNSGLSCNNSKQTCEKSERVCGLVVKSIVAMKMI